MFKKLILVAISLTLSTAFISAQVRVRLFSDKAPESAVFSVTEGEYVINAFSGETLIVTKGEPVILTRYNGKLAVKMRNALGFLCDSVLFKGKTSDDSFSLRINGNVPVRQYYSGDLQCFPDLGTLVLINICDVEKYISGVVRAEGGNGKNFEYFKTQAVIARTYMYKYFDKHLNDRYNVCDNTHCQAFNGLSSDTIINMAALETQGLVILGKDSTLIVSAFHSNCGGETSSSEDVWLTNQPYLISVVDPYCFSSRNATWEKRISLYEWLEYLKKSGYNGKEDDPSAFSFLQKSRLTDYTTGSFKMPLKTLRTEMNLRSTFFSVIAEGDSITLKGRGYGHGVGLCQEGAMAMAAKGFNYQQIIDFYYIGVLISDIKNAVVIINE
ncbi:MAG: SpoIID/LytB domain-containing protein [Bacteroidia bacterium]|nr:SpoIID/LytB domain-containing protein [Bacteroidia bacterium]